MGTPSVESLAPNLPVACSRGHTVHWLEINNLVEARLKGKHGRSIVSGAIMFGSTAKAGCLLSNSLPEASRGLALHLRYATDWGLTRLTD